MPEADVMPDFLILTAVKSMYAKNIHERLQPASLTKMMTALVALEDGWSGRFNHGNR